MNKIKINLEDYHFFGHNAATQKDLNTAELGKKLREDTKIDEVSKLFDKVVIKLPYRICRVCSHSFLDEFFKNIIPELGKEGFHEKFEFQEDGMYICEVSMRIIERILNKALKLELSEGLVW